VRIFSALSSSFFLAKLIMESAYLLRSDVFNNMPADGWKSADVVPTTLLSGKH
jgi:hypothetical protein